jgi:hypothetical protein
MTDRIKKWRNYDVPRRGMFTGNEGIAPEGWLEIQRDDEEEVFEGDIEAAEAVSQLVIGYIASLEMFVSFESKLWYYAESNDIAVVVPDPRAFPTYGAARTFVIQHTFKGLQGFSAKQAKALYGATYGPEYNPPDW